ncbi:SdpI family protein [Microbacterium sp. NPDC007973]|uniref:SdpI family protein n=1 Tax=Microbacterium sp. NPDC007973 TaxID=3364182 RepID=UPI0036F134FB
MIVALSTAVPLLIAGALIAWLAYRSSRGTLTRNLWMGIRTTSTMRSDEAWRVGHTAAVVPMAVSGAGLIAAGAAAIVAGEDAAVWAAMAGCAWAVVWLLVAAVVARRAVERMDADTGR